jgi:hypothetical protein
MMVWILIDIRINPVALRKYLPPVSPLAVLDPPQVLISTNADLPTLQRSFHQNYGRLDSGIVRSGNLKYFPLMLTVFHKNSECTK